MPFQFLTHYSESPHQVRLKSRPSIAEYAFPKSLNFCLRCCLTLADISHLPRLFLSSARRDRGLRLLLCSHHRIEQNAQRNEHPKCEPVESLIHRLPPLLSSHDEFSHRPKCCHGVRPVVEARLQDIRSDLAC